MGADVIVPDVYFLIVHYILTGYTYSLVCMCVRALMNNIIRTHIGNYFEFIFLFEIEVLL